MKKILITGFSGFVSHHFLDLLENNGISANIKGIDLNPPQFEKDYFKHIKYSFETIDLLNRDKVESTIAGFRPDFILHLAFFSSVAYSWKEPIKSFQNNTNIFLNLIESVRCLSVPSRILSIGSSEEYGNVEVAHLPLTEDQNLMPVSPYAVSRVSQEHLSRIYANGYGLDIIMTRSFNHIGPHQRDIFVVPSIVKQLVEISKKGKTGELMVGDIDIIRDFTDVRDVASAYYLLLNYGKSGEIYNVCSGKGFSIREIIEKIRNILNIEVTIRRKQDLIRPTENRVIIGSNQKICNHLRWKLKYNLDQSLKDMIVFWKTQI